jgi:hypothetical protein
MKEVLESVDRFRYKADSLIQNALMCKKSAETTLAWQSLQMAKSWLGKFKGDLGMLTPYGIAQIAKDIPKTAEVYEGELIVSDGSLQDINTMRQEIGSIIDQIEHSIPQSAWTPALTHSIKHFSEARFWYGFELANLRENSK